MSAGGLFVAWFRAVRSAVRCLLPMAVLPVAAAFAPVAHAAKEQVPDWVRQAAAKALPAYPPRTDAVVLLDELTYTVEQEGHAVERVRRAVRILRPQGRHYANMQAWFSNGDKLRYMHIWSIGADGHEYAPKDDTLTESSSWGGMELYSDDRARGATPPAIDTGAVAAMEYEREVRPYYNDIIWMPEERIPVLEEKLLLALPPGFKYTAAWKGKPATQATDLEQGRTLWQTSNLKPIKHENVRLAPSEISEASRLDVFYFGPGVGAYPSIRGDWKDIGVWFEALARDRNKPDGAIAAKAQELVAGKSDFRDRVEAIANFVQSNIRYVAIEIGVGGHQPHPAADVFKARYGDCKDKATLLSAMLQAVGIRGTWVMVDTRRSVVSSAAPSIAGNHMIAAIELPASYEPRELYSLVTTTRGKRFLIFDPTWEKTPFGDIESNLQGSDALLIDGADSQAIRIPVLPPGRNRIERAASYKLSSTGELTGSVEESRRGDIAADYRYHFGNADQTTRDKYVERFATESLRSVQVANIRIADGSDLSKPFTLRYDVRAQDYPQQAGSLLMVRPRVLGEESFALDRAEAGLHRSIPIDLGSTREVHDRSEIELPATYAVEELPEPLHFDADFATYASTVTNEGNRLRYERTLTIRKIDLPADRYGEVEALSRIIATDEQRTAVVRQKN